MTNGTSIGRLSNARQFDQVLFRLRDIEAFNGIPGWQEGQRLTHSYVLMIAANGRADLTLDHDDCRLGEDAVYICAPEQTYGLEAVKQEKLKLFLFKFDLFREKEDGGGREYVSESGLFRSQAVRICPGERCAVLCDQIFADWNSGDGLERFRSRAAFDELIYYIMKNREIAEKDSKTSMEQVKDYIDRNYHERITIDQLAGMAGISPKYFVDAFKKNFGISTMDYLTQKRIARAKELMAKPNAKLKDIAHEVGFNDEFYFSRKFKKVVHLTPSVYMKSRRRKIAAYSSAVIGQLLALNIIPYAAPLHPKWTAYYYKMYRNDIRVHLSAYRNNQDWESNIKTLSHVQPDVVLSMDKIDDKEKNRLNQVTNVFYVPWLKKNWREQLQLTAEFLGEPAEAEEWLHRYDRKVSAARERLKKTVKEDTFLFVRVLKQALYIHFNRSIAEVFFQDLQLTPAYRYDQFLSDRKITVEQLAELDPDHLLILVRREDETLAYWRMLQQSIAWQNIRAVRNKKVYPLSSDLWYEYSACAHERIIHDILARLSVDRPY